MVRTFTRPPFLMSIPKHARFPRAAMRLLLFSLFALFAGCQTSDTTVTTFDALEESPLADAAFREVQLHHGVASQHLQPPPSTARLGVGDVVDIQIIEEPGTLETCLVMGDGLLYYNLAGGIMAANRTTAELEEAIVAALKEDGTYPFPVVTVSAREMSSRSYTVLGQVGAPGSYPVGEPVQLLDAIARCGGLLDSADLRRCAVIRDNRMIAPDLEALVEEGDMSQNMYLRPGDYLFVPLVGRSKIHLLGQVNGPRSIPYDPRMSLVRAIVTAGGPTPQAALGKVTIVRGSSVAPKIATVDLDDIMKGRSPDIRLHPDDIVWLPTSPWQRVEEYALEAVRTATSVLTHRVVRESFRDDDRRRR